MSGSKRPDSIARSVASTHSASATSHASNSSATNQQHDVNGTLSSYHSANKHFKAFAEITSDIPDQNLEEDAVLEEYTVTFARKSWIIATWILTWWIPTTLIKQWGGMKRDDIRMAWREKVAICILIALACIAQLFFIIALGKIICPRQNIFTIKELLAANSASTTPLVGIYGAFYALSQFTADAQHKDNYMKMYAGLDITAGFPRSPKYYCSYASDSSLFSIPNLANPANGTFIAKRHEEFYTRNVFGAQRRIDFRLRNSNQGMIGWDPSDIAASDDLFFLVGERVYNLQAYSNLNGTDKFLPSDIYQLISDKRGTDLSSNAAFMRAWKDKQLRDCMNNLFIVGVVDFRKSARCLFTNYVLVAFSIFLAAIVGCKFLAAIQVNSVGTPEQLDKFVILQVPCYTEGEDSLRRTLESLAASHYDDKHKLMFIVCDGDITGSGNHRSTPKIVLDILGADEASGSEPLAFQSLGDGSQQYNRARVYTGLYAVRGHLVPYLVIVKVGKETEKSKPGNRGKRDSQVILMRFFNKVFTDLPMSPLELEMYNRIKNVIGIDPSYYEFCLMVDADTRVAEKSLIQLLSVMINDQKVMGVCGETRIANDKDTWATMIQVYEYFISHHLAKAFESLFGSVTCLPGCFSMYRLRSSNKGQPVLCSSNLLAEYADVNVDTLHKKNLLHLGEDRYLTTLLLKQFPHMKTVFAPSAKCDTVVPQNYDVLLSQRRRWINSTVHNLWELISIKQLCGFCCFSMRFVVLLDLLATIMQPAVVFYLGYLVYLIIASSMYPQQNLFPTVALILLGAVYGLQALVFLIRREWQHVGWMVIYLLAIPLFSLFIPMYSFWHMDDFSWGSTRVVVGESGKKQVLITEEEGQTFNIKSIPHKTWSQYEAETWPHLAAQNGLYDDQSDAGSQYSGYSTGSAASGTSLALAYQQMAGYGRSSMYSSSKRGSSFASGGQGNRMSINVHTPLMRPMSSAQRSSSPRNTMPNSPTASMGMSMGLPSDDEIFYEVQRILGSADLSTITKREIRMQLSAFFGVDLKRKRDYINQCINELLTAS